MMVNSTKRLPQKLLQVIGLLFVLSLISKAIRLDLTPRDVKTIVGEWPVNFTCVLDHSVKNRDNLTSSNLTFIFETENEVINIPNSYMREINETALELRYCPLIDQKVEADIKYVTCKLRHGYTGADSTTIDVKERHENPNITGKSVLNWKQLRVTWETREIKERMHTMTYNFWYKNNSEEAIFNKCPTSETGKCTVHDPFKLTFPAYDMIIKVNGSVENKYPIGILEAVSSGEKNITLNEILKPDCVYNMEVSPNESLALLAFKPPITNRNITFDIRITCKNDTFSLSRNITQEVKSAHDYTFSEEISTKTNTETEDIRIREEFRGLPPFSNCTASVRAISVLGGEWSEWETKDFETMEDVPLCTLGYCTGCYQMFEIGNSSRDILIYFTPLSEEMARGRVDLYRITTKDSKGHKTINEMEADKKFSFRLKGLSTQSEYKISVEAKTTKGYNESLKVSNFIGIPQTKPLSVDFLKIFTVIVLNQTAIRTTWEVGEAERSKMEKNILLFWCEGSSETLECLKILKWKAFLMVSNSYVIVLSEDESSHEFIFGIGVEDGGMSSGITWSKCTYDINGSPPTPEIESINASSSDVTVSLRELPCPSYGEERGYVVTYRLFFCQLSQSGSGNCSDSMKTRVFNRSRGNVLKVDGLNSSQAYLLVIQSLTVLDKTSQNSSREVITLGNNFVSPVIIMCIIVVVIVAIIITALLKSNFLGLRLKIGEIAIVLPSSAKRLDLNSVPSVEVKKVVSYISGMEYATGGLVQSSTSFHPNPGEDSSSTGLPVSSAVTSEAAVVTGNTSGTPIPSDTEAVVELARPPFVSDDEDNNNTDRILPFICGTWTNTSDISESSDIMQVKSDQQQKQLQEHQILTTSASEMQSLSSSGCESVNDDYFTLRVGCDQFCKTEKSPGVDEGTSGYISGSGRINPVILPVPSEPPQPICFDSNAELSDDELDTTENGRFSEQMLNKGSFDSGTSDSINYHRLKESLSPSSDFENNQTNSCDSSENDYPRVKLFEVEYPQIGGLMLTTSRSSVISNDDAISYEGISEKRNSVNNFSLLGRACDIPDGNQEQAFIFSKAAGIGLDIANKGPIDLEPILAVSAESIDGYCSGVRALESVSSTFNLSSAVEIETDRVGQSGAKEYDGEIESSGAEVITSKNPSSRNWVIDSNSEDYITSSTNSFSSILPPLPSSK